MYTYIVYEHRIARQRGYCFLNVFFLSRTNILITYPLRMMFTHEICIIRWKMNRYLYYLQFYINFKEYVFII